MPISYSNSGNALVANVSLHKMVADNTELGIDLARNHSRNDDSTITIAGITYTVPSSTDNSNYFGIRVRTAIVPAFRLQASAARVTGGSSTATLYGFGAEYLMGKDFGMGVDYNWSASSSYGSTGYVRGVSISGRYYY